MTFTRNHTESWEKQTIWDCGEIRLTVGFNHFYGEMVTRIDDANGYWHCSDGIKTLPDRFAFALAWLEPIHNGTDTLMRPNFERSE